VKGLVFTTFYDFVEARFGADMLEDVIDDAGLPLGGAYTSVGTYPFDEMVALMTAGVKRSGQSMPELMEQFGEFCFAAWVQKFPALFADRDLFDVLSNIDHFHEHEVRKLYPDAELPSFAVVGRSADQVLLDYRSCKPLADLAVGVMRGAARHLNASVEVSYQLVGDCVRFRVQRTAARPMAA
jgi:hypothetical protein